MSPTDDGVAAPPPSRPTTPEVPASLATAPAWIGRSFSTGIAKRESTLTTWILRREREQALLTIDEQVAQHTMDGQIGPWSASRPQRWVGTSTKAGATTTFTLSKGAKTMTLVCAPATVAAAAAHAVRVPHEDPRYEGCRECGDPGRWSPRRTTKREVLACSELREDDGFEVKQLGAGRYEISYPESC